MTPNRASINKMRWMSGIVKNAKSIHGINRMLEKGINSIQTKRGICKSINRKWSYPSQSKFLSVKSSRVDIRYQISTYKVFFKWKYLNWEPNGFLKPSTQIMPLNNRRHSTNTQKGRNSNSKPLPRLLYIQNPLVWVSNKLDFRYLRSSWDPEFSESEFTRGARQAVSKTTQLLSQNSFDDLKPLLTKNAMINLRRDVEILWADEIRRNIGFEPDDLQLILPRKLHFRRLKEKRFCDIDMVFIGLKYLDSKASNPPLVFVDIIARFHRNYTEGMQPDWTISAFKVRRFNVIPPKN